MKTLLIALVSCVAFGLCAQTNQLTSEQSAIVAIKPQFMSAATNSVQRRGKRFFFNQRKFADLIAKIDTHGCPTDFRVAWNDFTFAYHQRVNFKGSLAPLIEMESSVASVMLGQIGPAMTFAGKGLKDSAGQSQTTQDLQRKLEESEHSLKDVCIKYGL